MTPITDLALARTVWSQVVLINCGGTINMQGGGPARPGDGVAELFDRLGEGFPRERLALRSPFPRPPDSSAVGPREWAVLVDEIRSVEHTRHQARARLQAAGAPLLERGGIVVAHGTDTMQITSMVAALELAAEGLSTPIVFTGSWCPPSDPRSDALSNLAKAVFAATLRREHRPHNLPPGVYVLIGEDIHLASRLSKVGSVPNTDGRYFFSFPGPIAQMTSKDFSVKLDQGLLDRLAPHAPLDAPPRRTHPWGVVEHLVLDAFVDVGVLVDLAARLQRAQRGGARTGVVVQGDFTRHPRVGALVGGLRELADAGSVVVLGSRRAAQRVRLGYPHSGIVLLPRALSHSTARTKLSWLLGTDAPVAWLGALMATSVVGEVFDTDALPTWIKYETFPDQHAGTLVVPAWPDLPAAVVQQAAARLAPHRKATLHLFGFGYGHLPGPNRPLVDLLRDWLATEAPTLTLGEPQGPGAEPVVAALVAALQARPWAHTVDWVRARYRPLPRVLSSAIRQAVAKRTQARLLDSVQTDVEGILAELTPRSGGDVTPRRTDAAVQALLGELRFSLSGALLDAETAAGLRAAEAPAQAGLLVQCVTLAPQVLARRMLKDAVMASHPLLGAVGRAIDDGVRVEVHSLAARSWSDVSRYEAGTLLLALGVKAERGPWWKGEGLEPLA